MTRRGPVSRLAAVEAAIVSCERCPRLREYCTRVAREKRAAYRHETYWSRPVPGLGDPAARIYLLGLAPAAHGANRTGRMFTGDGIGGSGDFLMAALHRAGFANIPTAQRPDDGLKLTGVFIGAAVRCAPPANKPTPVEIATCLAHAEAEVAALPSLRIVVALGKIAWDAWFQLLAQRALGVRPRPAFGHGAVVTVPGPVGTLIGCYHPSRQNTNTGKVTPAMYDAIFQGAVQERLVNGARAATRHVRRSRHPDGPR